MTVSLNRTPGLRAGMAHLPEVLLPVMTPKVRSVFASHPTDALTMAVMGNMTLSMSTKDEKRSASKIKKRPLTSEKAPEIAPEPEESKGLRNTADNAAATKQKRITSAVVSPQQRVQFQIQTSSISVATPIIKLSYAMTTIGWRLYR